MMKMLQKITCCFNSLTTNLIEKIIIILSIIGLIISIIGLIVIPWGVSSKIMEVFYLLSMIFFIYSIFLSCFIKFSKAKKNEKLISCCKENSFIVIGICILSIILNIFIAIGAFPDFKNQKSIEYIETLENGEIKEILSKESKLVSNGELGFSIFSIILNIILWIILFILWSTEVIRLKYKIEGSYNDYLNEQKNLSTESVKNVIGHDKYGLPIYEGKKDEKLQISKSRSEINCKLYDKYDTENNVLKYSYKEKYFNRNDFKKPNSVDEIHKIKEDKKEKYIEKYIENGAPNPYYSNFDNKTVLNISSFNNSINPGY